MDFKRVEESEFVKIILGESRKLSFKRGEFVYHIDSDPKGLYFVETGLIGLLRVSTRGQDHLLRLFKAKQFFGHRSLFSKEKYHASARCIEDSSVLFCPKEKVFEIFSKHSQGYSFLSRALAIELRRAEIRSVIVSDGEVLERVASTILLFKSLYPDHLWTRAEIANFCASRTPTVIRALGKLEEMGAIEQVGRKINILNKEALLSLTV